MQIESMKESQEDMRQLEGEIDKKSDQIKLLNDQSNLTLICDFETFFCIIHLKFDF